MSDTELPKLPVFKVGRKGNRRSSGSRSMQGHSAIYFERGVEPTLPIDLFNSVHGKRARDAQSDDSSQKVLAKDRIAQLEYIRSQCIIGYYSDHQE